MMRLKNTKFEHKGGVTCALLVCLFSVGLKPLQQKRVTLHWKSLLWFFKFFLQKRHGLDQRHRWSEALVIGELYSLIIKAQNTPSVAIGKTQRTGWTLNFWKFKAETWNSKFPTALEMVFELILEIIPAMGTWLKRNAYVQSSTFPLTQAYVTQHKKWGPFEAQSKCHLKWLYRQRH